MNEQLWIGLTCLAVWACLPISVILSANRFDADVWLPGEESHMDH